MYTQSSGLKALCLNTLGVLERAFALGQGKGWGGSTIRREASLALQALDGPPQLVVDIGGNAGNYTAEIRRLCPSTEVHVFEPSACSVERLRTRFGADPNIHVVPSAASDVRGAATLFSDSPGSGLSSLSKRNLTHKGISFEGREQISTVRFEDYWRERLSRRIIDIAKLDIEGHELAALQGFGEAVSAVRLCQFEFGGCNVDSRTFFRDFWMFFESNGFVIHRITPLGLQRISAYRESDEFFITTNYLAVNGRIRL
jgi:FkbM family methyltransferase